MRLFGNAGAWLANLANASCHNQIWYTSYQLIASWCPYKEISWYKQHYMCAALVCACSVLLEYYDFQSFAILHELDTLQLLDVHWRGTQLINTSSSTLIRTISVQSGHCLKSFCHEGCYLFHALGPWNWRHKHSQLDVYICWISSSVLQAWRYEKISMGYQNHDKWQEEQGAIKGLCGKEALWRGLCNNKNNYKSKLTNINETSNWTWLSIPYHYKPSLTLLG